MFYYVFLFLCTRECDGNEWYSEINNFLVYFTLVANLNEFKADLGIQQRMTETNHLMVNSNNWCFHALLHNLYKFTSFSALI